MKSLITELGIFGPFSIVEEIDGGHLCDGCEYQSTVVGVATIGEFGPIVEIPVVPQTITMRQAQLALFQAGLLVAIDYAIDALPSPTKEIAHIEWTTSKEVWRHKTLVIAIAGILQLSDSQLDNLFIVGSKFID